MAREEIDIVIKPDTAAAVEELGNVGTAAGDAKVAVEDLDGTQLPSVTKAIADVHDEFADLRDAAGDAAENVDDTAAAAGDASTALHSMVGNSAQDLADLAGAGGPAADAIGTIADKAAAGAGNLGAMAATAGVIAGIGTVIGEIKDRQERIKEIKAFATRDIENFTKALYDGVDAADAVADSLSNVGEIRFALGSLGGDIVPTLAKMGVNIKLFSELVAGSEENLHDWYDGMVEAGHGGNDLLLVVEAIKDQQANLAAATDAAAIKEAVFGESTRKAATNVNELLPALGAVQEALRTYVEGLEDVPPEVKSKILADIDKGSIADAERELATLARNRAAAIFATVNVNGILTGSDLRNAQEGRGVTVVNNYHPPAVTPQQQHAAAQEYNRVQNP